MVQHFLGASSTGPGDPLDLDGDGHIGAGDLQQLKAFCTRPGCVIEDGELQIGINIKPGDGNGSSVNLKSESTVPVALLGSRAFDVAALDKTTLTFGHFGAEHTLIACDSNQADLNGDGHPDLICRFKTAGGGFLPTDTSAVLKARSISGLLVRGQGSLRIVP